MFPSLSPMYNIPQGSRFVGKKLSNDRVLKVSSLSLSILNVIIVNVSLNFIPYKWPVAVAVTLSNL